MTSDLIARIEASQPGETRGLLEEAAFEIANGNWSMDRALCFKRFLDAEAYLDAAMMLVPEGWSFSLGEMMGLPLERRWRCHLRGHREPYNPNTYAWVDCYRSHPALAIAAASLKAKDASGD